jgi:hypothetical protein
LYPPHFGGLGAQFYFCEVRAKEFFNTHAWLRQLSPRPPNLLDIIKAEEAI